MSFREDKTDENRIDLTLQAMRRKAKKTDAGEVVRKKEEEEKKAKEAEAKARRARLKARAAMFEKGGNKN